MIERQIRRYESYLSIMKYQLSIIIVLTGYLLSNCSGQKRLSFRMQSDETDFVNEEVLSKASSDTTVTDVEGNIYPVVVIGNKLWMGSNLDVSKYNNGTPISFGSDRASLRPEEEGKYVLYEYNEANGEKQGKLYNHYAVQEGCLCPEGWHVPSMEEWQEAIDAGGLKKLNLSQGGFLNAQDIFPFSDKGIAGSWWTSTSVGRNTVAVYILSLDSTGFHQSSARTWDFLSVRCVKDIEQENSVDQ